MTLAWRWATGRCFFVDGFEAKTIYLCGEMELEYVMHLVCGFAIWLLMVGGSGWRHAIGEPESYLVCQGPRGFRGSHCGCRWRPNREGATGDRARERSCPLDRCR